MVRAGGGGWSPLRAVPRIAMGAISVPVVVGFVALGAGIVVVRSLRDVARETPPDHPPRPGVTRPQPLTFDPRLLECDRAMAGRWGRGGSGIASRGAAL